MYRLTNLDRIPESFKVEVGKFPMSRIRVYTAQELAELLINDAEIVNRIRGYDAEDTCFGWHVDLVTKCGIAMTVEDIETELNRTALRIWTMQNDLQSVGKLRRQVAEMEMENNRLRGELNISEHRRRELKKHADATLPMRQKLAEREETIADIAELVHDLCQLVNGGDND